MINIINGKTVFLSVTSSSYITDIVSGVLQLPPIVKAFTAFQIMSYIEYRLELYHSICSQ